MTNVIAEAFISFHSTTNAFSYIYIRKRKKKKLLFFSPFLYLRDLCHYIVLLKMSNRQPHFLGRQQIIFVLQIQNTNRK